ncbi:MAG: TatD family hydrolase [Saprospiraceae bacterium]
MSFIDTHTHLYADQFKEDRDLMIERAIAAGVEQFFLPNIDGSSIEPMLQLEQDYPNRCFPMMGLHPCSVNADYQKELQIVEKWLNKRPFIAVGEIGIDLYWDKTFFEEQKAAFIQQVEWAKERQIPIVIHSRESTAILIELLKELQDGNLRGIFHCFGGSVEEAKAIIDLDFYLGIGGVLTFKKSGLAKTLESIELKHLVLETDSPYLAPSPFRGKRNESAYLLKVAEKLAEIKNISLAEIGTVTSENARAVFGMVTK